MSPHEAGKFLQSRVTILREDIARAKCWLIARPGGGRAEILAKKWLEEQRIEEPTEVNTAAADIEEALVRVARAYSLRVAFYQAVLELSTAVTSS